jgi:hypothetical protein
MTVGGEQVRKTASDEVLGRQLAFGSVVAEQREQTWTWSTAPAAGSDRR